MVEEAEKLVASWDTHEIMAAEVKYRLENWEDGDGGYDEKPDEEQVWEDLNMDYDLFDMWYQDEMTNQTAIVNKKCPDGKWHVEARNMGWQHRSGERDFDDIHKGQDFIGKCLGDGGEYHWWVWEDGDGFKVRVTHHDAPTGEWYYWKPRTPWFENVPA